MTENQSTDQFPSHMVYGEYAPRHIVISLLATGFLLAGVALWLFQNSTLDGPAPLAHDELPATARLTAPQQAGTQPMSQIQPASAPAVVRNSKPICPGVFSFYFATHETVPLTEDAREGLDAIVDWAQRHPSAKLYIEGHTDAVGIDDYNVLLSYQRAKAVVTLLEKSGIAPQQVQMSAMGSQGLIPGIPGHAKENRRVNIRISDPDDCSPQAE